MTMVKPRKHPKSKQPEPFDRMLRRFKKSCDRKGIVKEVRDRQYFEKPSSIKNTKNQAQKRKRKLDAIKKARKGFRRV